MGSLEGLEAVVPALKYPPPPSSVPRILQWHLHVLESQMILVFETRSTKAHDKCHHLAADEHFVRANRQQAATSGGE